MSAQRTIPLFRTKRIAACIGLALFTACPGPTFVAQQYAGPPRPSETIAVIRISGGTKPQIVSLDGEPVLPVLEPSARMHIEVLPGLHELEATAPERGVREPIMLRFSAEAGKVYRIEVRTVLGPEGESRGIAYAYEVDRGSDVPLGAALVEPVTRDAGR